MECNNSVSQDVLGYALDKSPLVMSFGITAIYYSDVNTPKKDKGNFIPMEISQLVHF